MLAGHDESGGEVIERDGKKFVQFYGMSSETAMEKHAGGVAEYRASEGKTVRFPPEMMYGVKDRGEDDAKWIRAQLQSEVKSLIDGPDNPVSRYGIELPENYLDNLQVTYNRQVKGKPVYQVWCC